MKYPAPPSPTEAEAKALSKQDPSSHYSENKAKIETFKHPQQALLWGMQNDYQNKIEAGDKESIWYFWFKYHQLYKKALNNG